jgi:hypothetical protein
MPDIGVNIDYFSDGQDTSISAYVETMYISLWKIAFFLEFSMEKGIHKNKRSKDQVNFKQAMWRVIFRYFKSYCFARRLWQELQHSLLRIWTRIMGIACLRKVY